MLPRRCSTRADWRGSVVEGDDGASGVHRRNKKRIGRGWIEGVEVRSTVREVG